MKKFYKVNLYKVRRYTDAKQIGTIIVESGIFYAKEIMTNQKFRIYSTINNINGLEKDIWMNKYQQYLFLVEKDFLDKNIATAQEVEKYIDRFQLDTCPFSKIVIMKEQETEEKRRLKEIKRKLK